MNQKAKPAQLLALLQEAIALHNHGRLDAADAIYRQVLQHAPKHPDALHLRALVCHAKEQFIEAAQLAEAAIRIAPRVANLHNTAGEAWRRQGQLDKAHLCLMQALRLDPAMTMAHHNLSLVYSEQARHAEASQSNLQALKLNPGYVEALVQGLEIACAQEDEGQAVQWLLKLEKLSAQESVRQAIARYHVRRARQFMTQHQFDAADQAAQAAIAAHPLFWGGWALRGEAHFEQLALAQAELFCTIAANLAPHNVDARLNLATLLRNLNRLEEATAHLENWLAFDPKNANARFSLAGIALMQGDYANGWANYEARWQMPGSQGLCAAAPQWEGQPVNRLLLYAEQGLGDSVQMLRFLPEVLRRCPGGVVLQVQAPLLRLARRVFGGAGVTVSADLPATALDAACPLMSLPRVLALHSEAQLLGSTAYLSASPTRTAEFSKRLSQQPGKKLGFVWRGSEGSQANRLRTLSEAALTPLLDLPGWTPVSLQFGVQSPTIGTQRLLDLSSEIADFEDLAAAMMAVDAVVSLDTGPAHLAGALGVRVFTLLPWLHDWRWGAAGAHSPWYASMSLFRQAQAGTWSDPINAVVAQLGGSPALAADVAKQPSDPAIASNHFPLVRANCRYGRFTLPLFDQYITRSMLAYGEYSPREAEVLASYLRPGDTAIDVGANLGCLTLAMARSVGPNGRVIAFEPQSMLHACLLQTLADNAITWVQARRQAAGLVAGVVRIGRSEAAQAQNFGGIGLVDGGAAEDVELVRLDDFAWDRCRVIKIDVEGLELEVLQGAASLIAQQRPVLCVECDRPGKREALLTLLKTWGYRVFKHEPPLFAPRNFRHCSPNLFPGLVSGNLLALPPGEHPPADASPL